MQPFEFRLVDAGEFRLPAIMRGAADAPLVLLVPPLFEEMNRCRRLLADIGRALAEQNIATLQPDLPGTGDCSHHAPSVAAWTSAIAALVSQRPATVFALRGGTLLHGGDQALGHYYFAPVGSGLVLLRDMMRAQAVADQERTGGKVSAGSFEARLAAGETVRLTGYDVTPDLAADLGALILPEPATRCRVAGLKPGGDVQFEGPPVWRQSEPAATRGLAAVVAADIATWIG